MSERQLLLQKFTTDKHAECQMSIQPEMGHEYYIQTQADSPHHTHTEREKQTEAYTQSDKSQGYFRKGDTKTEGQRSQRNELKKYLLKIIKTKHS